MKKNKNWILLKEFVKTDFKMRYQGSVIGYVWSVLKPLMLFAVMYTVFIYFLRFGSDIPNFSISLLIGTVLWGFFTETTSLGMTAIVHRGDLLRKLNFPKEIIILAVSVNAWINLCINLVIVFIFALINQVQISGMVLFLPLLLIELYILALGVAFLLSTTYVYFRDISPIWEVVLQIGMYMTPIIYPISMVLSRSEWIASILMMSPISQIIQDIRHILIHPANLTVWQIVNNPMVAIIPYCVPIVMLAVGYRVFTKKSKTFAEKV